MGRREDRRVEASSQTMGLVRRAGRVACALALLSVSGLAACSNPSSTASRPTLDVTMSDFDIKVSRDSVPAGPVVLHVVNDGPSTHEINVDLSRYDPAKLPLQRDGLTADEDAPGLHRINSIEQVNLRQSGDLKLDLKPGRYVLWCNLEGHYLGGMHASFEVQ